MSRFISRRYDCLTPYTPGEQPQDRQYIKLNTNESPYPPSPKVLKAISKEEIADLRLYPDPAASKLTKALARRLGVRPNQVFLGNGSDEVLGLVFMTFCDAQNGMAYPDVSYSFYPVFSRLCCIPDRRIPLRPDFTMNLADYHGIQENIIFPNPNAPTGILLSPEEIRPLLEENPNRLVIVDEAYIDFGGESCLPMVEEYENLLVVQTFSKSRSLAGARLGFAVGCPALIADLMKVKFSFNSYTNSRLSLAAGLAAVEDEEYFQKCTRAIMSTREDAQKKLAALGLTLLPSAANFVFAKPPVSGEEYYRKLKQRGVLVRHFSDPVISDWVRITIGTREQMEKLYAATEQIFEEANV